MAQVVIKSKVYDFTSHVPLRVKDFRALKAKGTDVLKLNANQFELDHLTTIASYVLHQTDEAAPEDLVDELTIQELNNIVTLALGGRIEPEDRQDPTLK